MTNAEIAKLTVARDFYEENIPSLINSLIATNKLIVRLTNSFYEDKVQIEYWKEHIEILLLKYSFHCSSFVKLLDGTTIIDNNGEEITFQDIPTLQIILRAAIENYLTINYLYFEPKNNDEGEFRYYLYQISGLNARQKFSFTNEEHIQKQMSEKLVMDQIISKLKENNHFKSLSLQVQKDILKRKSARIDGWEKMIEKSDLKGEMFASIWKLFSNTAHSEALGATQFKEYMISEKKHLQSEIARNIFCFIIMNASLITKIKDNYPFTQKTFNDIPFDFNTQIEFWKNVAQNKNGS